MNTSVAASVFSHFQSVGKRLQISTHKTQNTELAICISFKRCDLISTNSFAVTCVKHDTRRKQLMMVNVGRVRQLIDFFLMQHKHTIWASNVTKCV